MVRIPLALAMLVAGSVAAEGPSIPVYRCHADGVSTYVTKPIAGADCQVVTRAGVHAGRWEFVVRGLDGSVVSVDTTSIVRTGDSVDAWVQYEQASGTETKTLTRERFDCQARTATTSAVIGYRADGTQLRNVSNPLAYPRAVVPDAVEEAVWSRVCGVP